MRFTVAFLTLMHNDMFYANQLSNLCTEFLSGITSLFFIHPARSGNKLLYLNLYRIRNPDDTCSIVSYRIGVEDVGFRSLYPLLNKKAVLSQGNRAMPQLFFSV